MLSSLNRLPIRLLRPSNGRFPVRFSSSAQTKGASDTTSRLVRIARLVRYARIPFLVVSVYSIGYQQGIIDDSRDPEETRKVLLENVLQSVGITSREKVDIVTDSNLYQKNAKPETKRIAKTARSILKVARGYVQEELQNTALLVRSKLPSDLTETEFILELKKNDDFARWSNAQTHLQGSWSYLLLETQLPNAFVSEILPKRIFVTTAMMQMFQNDDELALVLGHEVSHLLLGHHSQRNMLETALRTLEVLLLSLDPTEGLLSLAFIGSLATLRNIFAAAFSRDHEREADELGIKFAAMACYNTNKAAQVFRRLHDAENAASTGKYLSFVDSHPPSEDRYRDLLEASATENASNYPSHCNAVRAKLQSIWP